MVNAKERECSSKPFTRRTGGRTMRGSMEAAITWCEHGCEQLEPKGCWSTGQTHLVEGQHSCDRRTGENGHQAARWQLCVQRPAIKPVGTCGVCVVALVHTPSCHSLTASQGRQSKIHACGNGARSCVYP